MQTTNTQRPLNDDSIFNTDYETPEDIYTLLQHDTDIVSECLESFDY